MLSVCLFGFLLPGLSVVVLSFVSAQEPNLYVCYGIHSQTNKGFGTFLLFF